MDQNRLLNIIREPIIHWAFLLVIYPVLFLADAPMNEPFWEYVLGLSKEMSWWLARGVAAIYLLLSYTLAQLLARDKKWLSLFGVLLFLLLSFFSFLGQEVAQEVQDNDPLKNLFGESESQEENSIQAYRAYISLGLTMVFFSCAVFIEYLIASTKQKAFGARKSLLMSSLVRWFQSKITILQGVYDRALIKLRNAAVERVNGKMQKLENLITECEDTQRWLQGQMNYQLELIELMHKQRIAIIEAVYNNQKTSFFKNLFS